ncbi:MAG TPA: LysM peptidoglycan-binding domain-containing protein [Gaiella sp.]|nr:LysM peptidoglycan-binding domain-containing protein [Gaiella sp.]
MRRTLLILAVVVVATASAAPAMAAQRSSVAALQVALRSKGFYTGAVDGISGPQTRGALLRFQREHGIRATGKVGMATRCKLGKLGTPLLGQRALATGRVGWDVAALEFRLRAFGLPAKRVDGRFDAATRTALRRFQRARGLAPDGVAGARTFRALVRGGSATTAPARAALVHRVRPGEGFAVIARRYGVKPASLARANGLSLESTIVPGQRLRVPGRSAPVLQAPRRRATPAPTLVHTVQPGEGFIAIAQRYGIRPSVLATANGLSLTSVIAPGQRLRIPGRRVTVAPVRTSASPAPGLRHTVAAGESFFSISQRYHVSPWRLARVNGMSLMATIVPGQRLVLPAGARLAAAGAPVDRDAVRSSLDKWSGVYGVDPKLTRALAWMESGFQEDVTSSAGAIGVMQLLPETWDWVDTILLRQPTPRTYDGNVRAGVRYLRWQLDQFGGDVKLALAGYYQGARAVRERGLFDDTKQYVSVILQLYGSV